jgi:hypothetical protein
MMEQSAKNLGSGVAKFLGVHLPKRFAHPWRRKTLIQTNAVENGEKDCRSVSRVSISQAVTVRFSSTGHYEFTGVSRDISQSGIFLYAESHMKEGAQVDVMLTLPSKNSRPVSLQVKGKVVRVETSSLLGIAIAFDRLVIAPDAAGTAHYAAG